MVPMNQKTGKTQYKIWLSQETVARLDAAAKRTHRKSGNALASEVIELFLPRWEDAAESWLENVGHKQFSETTAAYRSDQNNDAHKPKPRTPRKVKQDIGDAKARAAQLRQRN